VLLAVDLGLRSGVALYTRDGRLARFAAQSFANRTSLKRGVWTILSEHDDVTEIVVEGGACSRWAGSTSCRPSSAGEASFL